MNIDDYILQHRPRTGISHPTQQRNMDSYVWIPSCAPDILQEGCWSMLCKMIQPVHALELGTFTGYSALCIAESLPENGELDTIESDDELEEFILRNFEKTPFEDKINLLINMLWT